MTPSVHEHFQAGRLAEAIAAQTERVRQAPTDAAQRLALFGLLCADGQLDRADGQLAMLAAAPGDSPNSALVFRGLLQAEEERRRVFAGQAGLNVPPSDEAAGRASLGRLALALGGQDPLSADAAPSGAVRGMINGVGFDSLGDADELLGANLEVFAGGRYFWMPFARVHRFRIPEPRTVLDLLWSRAELQLHGAAATAAYVPVLYPGWAAESDVRLKLGRMTCWSESRGFLRGSGQRLLRTTAGDEVREHPILQVRDLVIDQRAGNGSVRGG